MKFSYMAIYICLLSVFNTAFAEPLILSLVGVKEDSQGWITSQALADEIGERVGTDILLVSLPTLRALVDLKSGKIDGDFSRVAGFEKDVPGLIQIKEPINSHPYIAYTTSQDITINGWESLIQYKVAYLRGWKVIETNLWLIHNNLTPLDTPESGLTFMISGRADIFINIPFIMDKLVKSDDFKDKQIIALQPPIDFLHVYIFLLPKHEKLLTPMHNALMMMKDDGTHKDILIGN